MKSPSRGVFSGYYFRSKSSIIDVRLGYIATGHQKYWNFQSESNVPQIIAVVTTRSDSFFTTNSKNRTLVLVLQHGVNVGPESRDPGIIDLGPPSKFKGGTRDPPLKFKNGTPGPPSKFKSGTPHISLIHFFSEYFFVFFYLFIFVSFLNKIQKNINCELQKSIVNTKDK